MAMNPELKAKWLADLRSGKFEQAKEVLHDPNDDRYCCLGVLCVTAGAQFTSAEVEDEFTTRQYDQVPVLDGHILSTVEKEELSLSWMNEIGMTGDQQDELIGMNDAGVPFSEIADYIEKNL